MNQYEQLASGLVDLINDHLGDTAATLLSEEITALAEDIVYVVTGEE